jgi:RND family efflux transporter MFP subunit
VEATEQQVEKIPVRVQQVSSQKIVDQLTVRGTVASLWSVDIFPDGAGKIIKKNVNVGDRVNKDQVLAQMIQDIPGMEFSPSDIEATVGGTITTSMVEIGSQVNPQRPAFTVSQLDSVIVLAQVLESDLMTVKKNSASQIAADALPDRKFTGRVRKIFPTLDARTKTATVEIVLPNNSATLKPGMTVDCAFSQGSRISLTVPLDAVSRSGVSYSLVKIINNKAKIIQVNAGSILSDAIEISGNIAKGDTIVVYGQNLLQDGSEVEIIK